MPRRRSTNKICIHVNGRLGVSSAEYQFSEHALERYLAHFGPLDQRVTLANHTVWLINAPGLVDEDRERSAAGMSFAQWAEARPDRTIAYVQSLANGAFPSLVEAPAAAFLCYWSAFERAH